MFISDCGITWRRCENGNPVSIGGSNNAYFSQLVFLFVFVSSPFPGGNRIRGFPFLSETPAAALFFLSGDPFPSARLIIEQDIVILVTPLSRKSTSSTAWEPRCIGRLKAKCRSWYIFAAGGGYPVYKTMIHEGNDS